MTTTLQAPFLAAALLVEGFKPEPFRLAQAHLLFPALSGKDVSGADIPETVTDGNQSMAGCATGALVAIGLLVVVGRMNSPKPVAKGRKLNILRLPNERRPAARAWLKANHFKVEELGEQLPIANL